MLGGISTGQDLIVSIAIKPTSSIRLPRASIDRAGKPTTVETHGRHDPCVGIRAAPIAEAMLALVVMDHALRHRAQCGDVRHEVPPIPARSITPSPRWREGVGQGAALLRRRSRNAWQPLPQPRSGVASQPPSPRSTP